MEEAGGGNTPAYNEKAWENMESLLDKHLPVKKKKRRIIFFLLPLALAGGVAFFLLTQQKTRVIRPIRPITQKTTEAAKSSPVTGKSSGVADKTIAPTDNNNTAGTTRTIPASETTNAQQGIPAKENTVSATGKPLSQTTVSKPSDRQQQKTVLSTKNDKRLVPHVATTKTKRAPAPRQDKSIAPDDDPVATTHISPADKKPSPVDNTPADNQPANTGIADKPMTPAATDTQATDKDVAKTTDAKKEDSTATAAAAATDTEKQKGKTPASGKFSINLSVGPDISSVGIDNPGKLQLQYGLGVGYAISNRFTVRTGFFAARKIYTADSTSYKTSYTIHNLKKIEANCLVYEIPLIVQYNFAADKRHNWFVAGGLSSYLMKKETYGYYYENAWGTPQFYERSYKNENTHLFSVINLSGGYQYHISDRFSIMAEPYIKIPASGVGAGKVKLNSGGVLFTAAFKPFLKKN